MMLTYSGEHDTILGESMVNNEAGKKRVEDETAYADSPCITLLALD